MKKLLTILSLLTCGICSGQNLVPNGDFELFSSCPTSYGLINFALSWLTPTLGTPDYYNQCAAPASGVAVPFNWGGYQQAHSGVAYSGISLYYDNWANYREYLEIELSSPLIANTCYNFEMFANLPDTCRYTISSIAIYFSDSLISGISNYSTLPFIPQLNNTTFNIIDTLNWTLISGTYTAMGGERYLTIGNFLDDFNTNAILVDSTTNHNDSYCYIDDVSLTACSKNGVSEQNENTISIYPNPVSKDLKVQTNNYELTDIILYDISSRKVLQQSFISSTTLNTEQLTNGIYLYEVRNKNGIIKNGKIIKE